MTAFDIVCGGARQEPPTKDGTVLRLNAGGPERNVNLRVSDISRTMLAAAPDVLVDLLEIAAYIYCADQQCSRGSEKLPELGRE